MNLLFQSVQPANIKDDYSDEKQIRLQEVEGKVPKYLRGSFVRNGPGVYEFGNSTFNHAFDPIAVLQKITFKDGKVFYGVSDVECDHYTGEGYDFIT